MQPGWLHQGWVKWILSFSIKVCTLHWWHIHYRWRRLTQRLWTRFNVRQSKQYSTNLGLAGPFLNEWHLVQRICVAWRAALLDMSVEQGIQQIQYFTNHLFSRDPVGNLMLIALQSLQLESGSGLHLLENPEEWVSYITSCWLTCFNSRISQLTHNQDHGCICQVRAAQLRAWPSNDGRGTQIGCLWELKEF
jgi:hypothetical protein